MAMRLGAKPESFLDRSLRDKALVTDFERLAAPTIRGARVHHMDGFIQHGDTTTLDHTVAVAFYSLALARRLSIKCDEQALVRAALLHDYFLYDWHAPVETALEPHKNGHARWHGFTHPRKALANAQHDFDLSDVEKDAILHHMFPLVPAPPLCREGWLITFADKVLSTRETFSRNLYQDLRTIKNDILRKTR